MTRDAKATFRTTDLPISRPARPITTREDALHEIERIDALRAQGIALTPETNSAYDNAAAFLATERKAVVAAAYEACLACEPGSEGIVALQHAVEEAYANLSTTITALKDARKDDDAKRRTAKRAINAARAAGVPEAELPKLPREVSKMADLIPGVGEQGWPSRYGRS